MTVMLRPVLPAAARLLDAHLATRPYLLGEAFSIADVSRRGVDGSPRTRPPEFFRPANISGRPGGLEGRAVRRTRRRPRRPP